jgi:hypothetical protein
MPLDAAGRDGKLAQDATAFDHAPTRRFQGGINQFGSGFGFVHEICLGALPGGK